jgi:GT2 family glycosyltransferase
LSPVFHTIILSLHLDSLKLSVIIVNYNVRWFLTQCLDAVQRAMQLIEGEVIVIDNHSSDDSVAHIQKQFPDVLIIANTENLGFSKANNLGIQQAKGKYVLLLNPDTVVAEDTFQKCLQFMDTHPEAGALGVRMIDGSGRFLPESKRGLPTPFTAFCKAFGLSALFPRSKQFNRYHLGFLEENKTAAVDVLSGAFMFIRREALDKSGLLDEQFFMYGEDIDLSYRIQQAGYVNYYFPETTILHYKGESTKKGSLNYVRVFYGAMEIFARKHFSQQHSLFFQALIRLAIFARGLLTLISGLLSPRILVLLDTLLTWSGLMWISAYWAEHIKHGANYFPQVFLTAVLPAYILMWIGGVWFSGGYEKPYRFQPLVEGLGWSTVALLALYGLLPEDWRFSRAVILLGGVWTALHMTSSRWIHSLITRRHFFAEEKQQIQLVFAGERKEWQQAESLMHTRKEEPYLVGITTSAANQQQTALCTLAQLPNVYRQLFFDEVIFSARTLTYGDVLQTMHQLSGQCSFRIYHAENHFIIGSDSKNDSGEWLTGQQATPLHQARHIRQKRRFDILLGFLLLVFSPLLLWRKNIFLLGYIPAVWRGKYTWIGGYPTFPEVKAVWGSAEHILSVRLYAETYTASRDWRLVWEEINITAPVY